ncbi:GyrI-like domain-containing protein [Rhodococcus fascians]|nr:GyrI-like domain-containing protein [Rhodococcus fascians]MBY3998499.1 GyrI-like domain-containing protein [Rhodococcus fascians]MBY4004507.1 GyrI-like domain-containing protein [Rhodococcus fascians]MBY4009312.1 GyrI-like domain-containing protein [Rhodococcus fascians]MBY4019714.1 GyrI-like domain-containing protein [Rhodococcus fascians]
MSFIQSTEHLHAADNPEFMRTPRVAYVSVMGAGAPGTDEFYRKKALVSDIARALNGADSTPVIEIQYWYPEGSTPVGIADFYTVNPIPSLLYRVLAEAPEGITQADIESARTQASSAADTSGDNVEVFSLPEQDVVQIMHHGPFADEFATLDILGDFAQQRGLRRRGPHHEIHLDGFTRTTPQETLRTILRDPVS